ncbi:MAG: hypothetical protein JW982_04300 [Spirochaetes bacterium]|nr:hypothetical protein [Spirochaetota bacterium]
MINSYKYKIQKLIERKSLLKKKIWQYEQIKKSTTNPVAKAETDEKIDAAAMSLQDVLITIESYYAEMNVVAEGI